MKRILSLLCCTALLLVIYPANIKAISATDRSAIVNAFDLIDLSAETVDTLHYLGLDYTVIKDFLSLQAHDIDMTGQPSVSSESNVVNYLPLEQHMQDSKSNALVQAATFDGNPPENAYVLAERMKYIVSTANQNFSNLSNDRYGDYLYYLYMSHYIDNVQYNPSSPNFDSILATYICADDLTVYNNYKNISVGGALYTSMKSGVLSLIDIHGAVTNIQDYLAQTQTLVDLLVNSALAAQELYDDREDFNQDFHLLIDAINKNYDSAESATALVQLIKAQNNFTNEDFMADIGKLIVFNAIRLITNTGIISGFIVGGVSIIMNYYYNIFTVATLAAMSASFNLRLGQRTFIYMGWDPRPN